EVHVRQISRLRAELAHGEGFLEMAEDLCLVVLLHPYKHEIHVSGLERSACRPHHRTVQRVAVRCHRVTPRQRKSRRRCGHQTFGSMSSNCHRPLQMHRSWTHEISIGDGSHEFLARRSLRSLIRINWNGRSESRPTAPPATWLRPLRPTAGWL